jgi:hypothetical protein
MVNKPSRATVHLLRRVTLITKVSLSLMVSCREYWMIYRGPGFIAVVWYGSSPTHSLPPVSKLSLFLSLSVCRRTRAFWLERGWERSQIIRRRESLVLYKLFNALRSQALPDVSFLKQTSSRECFAPMTEKWKLTQLCLQVCPCNCPIQYSIRETQLFYIINNLKIEDVFCFINCIHKVYTACTAKYAKTSCPWLNKIPKLSQNTLKKPAQQNKDVRHTFSNSCQDQTNIYKRNTPPREYKCSWQVIQYIMSPHLSSSNLFST